MQLKFIQSFEFEYSDFEAMNTKPKDTFWPIKYYISDFYFWGQTWVDPTELLVFTKPPNLLTIVSLTITQYIITILVITHYVLGLGDHYLQIMWGFHCYVCHKQF